MDKQLLWEILARRFVGSHGDCLPGFIFRDLGYWLLTHLAELWDLHDFPGWVLASPSLCLPGPPLSIFCFNYLFTLAMPGLICGIQIFISACGMFSCGVWDLVPWPEMQPGPPALGVWSLATGPPGKSPTTPNFHHRLSFLMPRFRWQSTSLLFLPSPNSLSKCNTHKKRRVNLFTTLMIKLAFLLPSSDHRKVYSLSWYPWGIGSRTAICGCQSLCVLKSLIWNDGREVGPRTL